MTRIPFNTSFHLRHRNWWWETLWKNSQLVEQFTSGTNQAAEERLVKVWMRPLSRDKPLFWQRLQLINFISISTVSCPPAAPAPQNRAEETSKSGWTRRHMSAFLRFCRLWYGRHHHQRSTPPLAGWLVGRGWAPGFYGPDLCPWRANGGTTWSYQLLLHWVTSLHQRLRLQTESNMHLLSFSETETTMRSGKASAPPATNIGSSHWCRFLQNMADRRILAWSGSAAVGGWN